MTRSTFGAALAALVLPALAAAPLRAQDEPPPPTSPPAAAPEEAPAPPTKASLAVMPFNYTAELLEREDGVLRLAVRTLTTSAFTNKFVTALVKTRKFDVVERQRVDDILNEVQLSQSGMTSKQRAIKAGQMIGADYFLTGEISVFSITTTWAEIPFTKKSQRTIEARIIVDMRIVDTRSSKVVAADKGEARWTQKTMFPNRFESAELPADMIDTLERTLCDDLTLKTIDGVYPIKIIGITGGEVSLNRGDGGGLAPGLVLDVFLTGDEMVDPDTGESLGFEELKVGRVQVSEILPRFSKATVVSGAAKLVKGAICRRVDEPEAPEPTPPRRGPAGW